MRELALFAGAGGGILGGILLGWRTVCAVENNEYARSVLLARQNDGCFEPFPIWDDVCTFDGHPWRGSVDVVSGGFPCTDISSAGNGAGIEGEESGLWKQMARCIGEVECPYVFVENSPMLTSRGLGTVLGDLAEMGFDAEWGVIGANAASIRAPHQRNRIWIVARHPNRDCKSVESINDEASRLSGVVADTNGTRREGLFIPKRVGEALPTTGGNGWWESEPNVGRVADGVAFGTHRLVATGNGQVGSVAALSWSILLDRIRTF